MDQQNNLKQLQDLFNNAKDILIITREVPTIDGLSASLALYQLLSNVRDLQGKNKRVVLAVSSRNGSQYSLLPGHDKIVSELGLRDFVIGVNGYVDGAIEGVNWYVDKGRLNVVFKSNPHVPMQFDLKNLDPFYAGANFDVVVVVDVSTPTDLGNAYRQDPGMYSELPVVNISKDVQNSRFGRVNIVDPQVGAVSELCYQLTQILRLPLTSDTAGLFTLGIKDGTNNLQNKGQQSDVIISQLQQYNPRHFELEAVRAQGLNAPLPVHKTPPTAVPQAGYNQMPQINPYMAPMQYPYPPQTGYPQPGAQFMPQYYPPYPTQMPQSGPYAYPQYQPQAPVVQNNQYQEQLPSSTDPVLKENQEQVQNYEEAAVDQSAYQVDQAMQEYDVPSIQHDYAHQDAYIPTSEIDGSDHVEPSLSMPYVQHSVTQNEDYLQAAQANPDPNIEEKKEQYKAPDWSAPPKIFGGGGEKSKG